MKKRDDIRNIVAAALIVYAAFTALNAQRRLTQADALRRELSLRADVLAGEAAALEASAAQGLTDELVEALARERLGLVRQGEIIFYFTGSD